ALCCAIACLISATVFSEASPLDNRDATCVNRQAAGFLACATPRGLTGLPAAQRHRLPLASKPSRRRECAPRPGAILERRRSSFCALRLLPLSADTGTWPN